MRAVLLLPQELLQKEQELIITDNRASHLIKSVRIQVKDELLLLRGNGTFFKGRVKQIEKKALIVSITSCGHVKRGMAPELFIGLVKKDEFLDIVRMSVEQGISSIRPFLSEYSQRYTLNHSRIEKVVESALIQSNNPYLTEVRPPINIKNLGRALETFDLVFYFSSSSSHLLRERFLQKSVLPVKKIALIIGPEGGLSEGEEQQFFALKNIQVVHLKMPILKAPTACCVAYGYIYRELTQCFEHETLNEKNEKGGG